MLRMIVFFFFLLLNIAFHKNRIHWEKEGKTKR